MLNFFFFFFSEQRGPLGSALRLGHRNRVQQPNAWDHLESLCDGTRYFDWDRDQGQNQKYNWTGTGTKDRDQL